MSLRHETRHFADRRSAGRALAAEFLRLRLDHPIVLALPRGGVPVAREVADALGAEFDLLLVRKIGAPGHGEYAIGAVAEGSGQPQLVVSAEVLALVNPPPGYVEREQERQLEEIERRRLDWRGGRQPLSLTGRQVIIVDDGIATGSTARVAIRAAREKGAKSVVLAVPVAPADVLESLAQEADTVVCLATPDPFIAVSLHYEHFDQLGDEDVLGMLGERAAPATQASGLS